MRDDVNLTFMHIPTRTVQTVACRATTGGQPMNEVQLHDVHYTCSCHESCLDTGEANRKKKPTPTLATMPSGQVLKGLGIQRCTKVGLSAFGVRNATSRKNHQIIRGCNTPGTLAAGLGVNARLQFVRFFRAEGGGGCRSQGFRWKKSPQNPKLEQKIPQKAEVLNPQEDNISHELVYRAAHPSLGRPSPAKRRMVWEVRTFRVWV